jgi:PAS domain S-box-containing protein
MSSRPDFHASDGEAGSVIDVTKRGQAEQATAKLATIVETSDDAIISKSKRTEEALWRSEALLQAELADTKLLQDISSELVSEGDVDALYEKIVAAAVTIMRSDFASMQRVYPERGTGGGLRLLAFRGFNSEAAKFWERVRADADCTCGIALRSGIRIIEPDVARPEIVTPGSPHHSMYLQNGIAAVQSTPLRSRSGELVGIISTCWRQPHRPSERDLRLLDILARQAADLIERNRAEQALARLAAIVETSDDAIISKDLNGIIITWNRGAERLFGYRAQETIGLPVTILIPPDRIDEEATILARIRRGERVNHYETIRRRKDGTLVDVSLSVSPVADGKGKVVGASKIARDISERKRFDEELRASEAHFRTLCDSTPALIWISGPSGCEFVNRSYLDFFGASLDDVRGSGWVRYVHPEDRERYVGGFLATTVRRAFFEGECRFRRADGIYRQTKTVGVARLSPAGDLLGYVGSTYDITDVKEAETVLREADRRKDEFLAMLSHELRNPLAPIRHAVTLLQEADDGEIRRRACAILDRQTEHMTRLVEDLLDISRISRGDINVRKQEVDLAAVVQAAIETSHPLVEARAHRLDITLPGTPVSVFADHQRLAQVVSNLLNNAAKYTPRGGRIGLEVSRADGAVSISVRDNGFGIPADELPRLFGMFAQLDGTRGRAPGGLGVGLALARQLVELHGGTIEARSDGPGRGSEFTVRIPLPGTESASV